MKTLGVVALPYTPPTMTVSDIGGNGRQVANASYDQHKDGDANFRSITAAGCEPKVQVCV